MLLAHRVGEQERVLEHDADRPPHVAQARLAHVDAVDAHVARVARRRSAGSGARWSSCPMRSRRRARPPRRRGSRDRARRAPARPRPYAERDVVEPHVAGPVGQRRARAGTSSIAGSVSSTVVDPPGRRRRTRQLPDEHADHAQRPDQHQHVEVGGDDVADVEVARRAPGGRRTRGSRPGRASAGSR